MQIEGGGGGNVLPVPTSPTPLKNVPFPAVHLTNLVCGWTSTIGSVSGMMTGVSPAYLLKNHVPKGQAADESRFSMPHSPLSKILKDDGYHVDGFSGLLCFREQIPFFGERHTGVHEEMLCHVPSDYAHKESIHPKGMAGNNPLYRYGDVQDCPNASIEDDVILERVRGAVSELDGKAPIALFIHLGTSDTIPELFHILAENGINSNNSIILVLGDHGFPGERFNIAQSTVSGKFAHDKGMTEQDLRIAGFVGYPGCVDKKFESPCISWDMAPTIAELLGYDADEIFPAATGFSLVPYLNESTKYPLRTLRIDNRYIEQEELKIVCLLNDQYRYIFRYCTNWSDSPYYNYHLEPVPFSEELFFRDDIDEQNNLLFSPQHLPILQQFRALFEETESAIMQHHFGNNVFSYPPLNRVRFQVPEPFRNTINGRIPVSEKRVYKGLVAALKLEMQEKNLLRPLLVGSPQEIKSFLDCSVFNARELIAAVTEANDREIAGLPVVDLKDIETLEYDCIILGSHTNEFFLYSKWNTLNSRNVPLLSPYRRLQTALSPNWPIATPDEELLDYFRTKSGVLYGAGGRCKDFIAHGGYSDMGMKICAILDSSPEKHGTDENGIPIYTYSQLSNHDIEALEFDYFLVSSYLYREILKDIQHWSLNGKKIFYLNKDLIIEPDSLPREGTWQQALKG